MASDPRIGTTLAGFRIESLLGRGGMSVVYRAQQERPRRQVALKLLAPELSADAGFRERFERESEAAASIDHPNVVPVFATGEADGTLFIAMRLVDGVDLGQLIRREGALDVGRAVEIVEQVASALDAAHALGLVHRDVKPGNVLVAERAGSTGRDHAYLSDFGLITRHGGVSGLTRTGQFMGSVAYVAPEQIQGESVDARADGYSLGCVLVECLTGQPPFPRENEASVLWAHMQDAPPSVSARREDVPTSLDDVVARAMAKDPSARFASCGELARAAWDALGAAPTVTPAIASTVRDERPPRRGAALLVGSLAAAVAIAVAVALALTLSGDGGGSAAPTSPSSPSSTAGITPEANTLVAIDPATGELLRSIEVGDEPYSTVVSGSVAWTANTGEGTLTWANLAGEQTQTIPLSLEGPDASIVSDGEGGVWAFIVETRKAVHVSGSTLSVDRSVQMPAPALALVFLPDGSAWETTGFYQDSAAIEFDPETGDEIARVGTAQGPVYLAWGLGNLWALAYNGQELDRIDAVGAQLSAAIAIPTACVGLGIGPSDVWVGTYSASKVFRIDPVHDTVVDQIGVGREIGFIVATDERVWVGNEASQTISVIDPNTDEVVDTIELGFTPGGAGLDEDGTLWVSLSTISG